jgi:uncharacterized protein YkwD
MCIHRIKFSGLVNYRFPTRLHITIFISYCLFTALLPATFVFAETNLAEQTLIELNLARTDPHGYADILREFLRQFQGKSYCLPGSETMVRTSEGVKVVNEAIRFLLRQTPLPPLDWSRGLAAAAEELVDDEGKSGAVGHEGKLSGGPSKRIGRHCARQGMFGENIFYGPGEARLVIMSLIIDDGVPNRGHRKNIFARKFDKAGVACGYHPRFDEMCVIDFADESTE